MTAENLNRVQSSAITSKGRLLLVDDDPSVLASLRRRLLFEGYQVETAVTGQMALELLADQVPDLVILDVMLPEMDGFEVLQQIRLSSSLPVLMLTARDAIEDRVQGLSLGADDYLVKPFAVEELLARVQALMRRSGARVDNPGERLSFQSLTMDQTSHQLFLSGRPMPVTPKEWELLKYFMRHQRRALTREQILTDVWGYEHEGSSNVVDVCIRSLREKLKARDPAAAGWLQTVRGVGYMLSE